MSIDLQTAIDKDMAVIHEDGTTEYVENETIEDVVSDREVKEVPQNNEAEESGGNTSVEDDFFN